jgi:DNA polymerase I-like protein with 3'-5' exonuclease and polymerase domains
LGLPGSDAMQAAYLKDPRTDFHQMVADMAGIKRKQAKTIGLGITYGMGKQKLATSLDMSVDEASTLITLFHQKVPFLRSTIDAVMRRIESPASGGAIRTLLGRKCRFPLFEPVAWGVNKALPYEQAIIEYGPRVKRAMTYKGLNRLIQGSAADQTKAAMVALDKAGFRVLLQLHDEIVVSVKTREEAEEVGRIMATTVELSVPSVVDVETGNSWGTAK